LPEHQEYERNDRWRNGRNGRGLWKLVAVSALSVALTLISSGLFGSFEASKMEARLIDANTKLADRVAQLDIRVQSLEIQVHVNTNRLDRDEQADAEHHREIDQLLDQNDQRKEKKRN